MSLDEFAIPVNKDHLAPDFFEFDDKREMSFPCCCCKHSSTDPNTEGPCANCKFYAT